MHDTNFHTFLNCVDIILLMNLIYSISYIDTKLPAHSPLSLAIVAIKIAFVFN